MVEKLTLNDLATALVDICGIMLSNKTAYFRVAFYCLQNRVHLCNDYTVESAS